MGEDHSLCPGVLDNVLMEIIVPWLLEDRDNSIRDVLGWIGMFDGGEQMSTWTDRFIVFVDQHVQSPEELSPIRSRLVSGVWSGSYANKLELVLGRVETLGAVTSNSAVVTWTKQLGVGLHKQIQDARLEEANREAGYRA